MEETEMNLDLANKILHFKSTRDFYEAECSDLKNNTWRYFDPVPDGRKDVLSYLALFAPHCHEWKICVHCQDDLNKRSFTRQIRHVAVVGGQHFVITWEPDPGIQKAIMPAKNTPRKASRKSMAPKKKKGGWSPEAKAALKARRAAAKAEAAKEEPAAPPKCVYCQAELTEEEEIEKDICFNCQKSEHDHSQESAE